MTAGESKIKCPICYGEHEVDKYGWVQACVGYFPKEVLSLQIHEIGHYLMMMRKTK